VENSNRVAIALAVILVIAIGCSTAFSMRKQKIALQSTPMPTIESTSEPTAKPKPTTTSNSAEKGITVLTLSKFNSMKTGMTEKRFISFLGYKPTVMTDAGEGKNRIVMYSVSGEARVKGDAGANAIFTFYGGKLQSKTQWGLK